MPSIGYLTVRAFASRAQLPLKDVAISVTSSDGTVIAMRLTDRSGLITPIPLPVPDLSESQSPNPDEAPYTLVNVTASKRGYESIISEGIQIFPEIMTSQDLEMVPLSEFPRANHLSETFETYPQDL